MHLKTCCRFGTHGAMYRRRRESRFRISCSQPKQSSPKSRSRGHQLRPSKGWQCKAPTSRVRERTMSRIEHERIAVLCQPHGGRDLNIRAAQGGHALFLFPQPLRCIAGTRHKNDPAAPRYKMKTRMMHDIYVCVCVCVCVCVYVCVCTSYVITAAISTALSARARTRTYAHTPTRPYAHALPGTPTTRRRCGDHAAGTPRWRSQCSA